MSHQTHLGWEGWATIKITEGLGQIAQTVDIGGVSLELNIVL